ncbi:MAG: hypothetical protein CVT64_01790 [Actinobacteria bacterium HGW-Actinobacteria-4]|nr:MAG: hypothetical protein CVT64_01790 [Actinobacteria bacterium HGW-Actinobacteria-4]
MAEWDDKTGKLRPTWTVRFSPWWVFIGSGIAGVVTTAVLLLTILANPEALNADSREVAQGAVLLLGVVVFVFLLIGPMLAYGVGFALRNVTSHGIHVVAFAFLGLIVGFMLGGFIGDPSAVAPAVGIGAAVGRWAISGQAKI